MKKSFALLFTIFLLTTVSLLSIYTIEIKAFQNSIETKEYIYTQAKLHLDFAKKFIKNLDFNDDKCNQKIEIENKRYDIYAKFSCINDSVTTVDLYVKDKNSIYSIELHERFLKKL